jgi:hypothetical protein
MNEYLSRIPEPCRAIVLEIVARWADTHVGTGELSTSEAIAQPLAFTEQALSAFADQLENIAAPRNPDGEGGGALHWANCAGQRHGRCASQ